MLTPGKAFAEHLKAGLRIYPHVVTPQGCITVYDMGHPTVGSKFSYVTQQAARLGKPGEPAFMGAVAAQSARLFRNAIKNSSRVGRGEKYRLSTLLDHNAATGYDISRALAQHLAKEGLDATVVVTTKKGGGQPFFRVLSSGYYINPLGGTAHPAEFLTARDNVQALETLRQFPLSQYQRRFDYEAVRPGAERRRVAMAAKEAARRPAPERESPTAERDRTMREIADDNRRSPLPTDILEGRVRAANQKAETRRRLRKEGYDV